MGIIATITPGIFNNSIVVPKRKITDREIKTMSSDVVNGYDKREAELLRGLMFKKYDIPVVQDKYESLDMLWKCIRFIKLNVRCGQAQCKLLSKENIPNSLLYSFYR